MWYDVTLSLYDTVVKSAYVKDFQLVLEKQVKKQYENQRLSAAWIVYIGHMFLNFIYNKSLLKVSLVYQFYLMPFSL